jgi:hypothetical protein
MILKNDSSLDFIKYEMPQITDSLEKFSRITADVAERVRNEMTGREPPNVVVIIYDGRIQNIIADKPVEAYIVDCDTNSENKNGENGSAWICGLPVTISKRKNVIAPRLVNEVVRTSPVTVFNK